MKGEKNKPFMRTHLDLEPYEREKNKPFIRFYFGDGIRINTF